MDTWLIALFSVVLGFVLAAVPGLFDRRREEIEYCHDGGLGLHDAGVLSPLGRLPTAIYDEVLKHIVAERDIEPAEVRPLMRYYDLVRQVNVSLNIIASALAVGESVRAEQELRRTLLKTARFAVDHPESYYAPVIAFVNARCGRPWWKFR